MDHPLHNICNKLIISTQDHYSKKLNLILDNISSILSTLTDHNLQTVDYQPITFYLKFNNGLLFNTCTLNSTFESNIDKINCACSETEIFLYAVQNNIFESLEYFTYNFYDQVCTLAIRKYPNYDFTHNILYSKRAFTLNDLFSPLSYISIIKKQSPRSANLFSAILPTFAHYESPNQRSRSGIWIGSQPNAARERIGDLSEVLMSEDDSAQTTHEITLRKIIKCPLCRKDLVLSGPMIIFGQMDKCSICDDNLIDIYLPCGHACICQSCYHKF